MQGGGGRQSISCFLLPTDGTVTGCICAVAGCDTKMPDKVPEEVRDEVQDLWLGTARGSRGPTRAQQASSAEKRPTFRALEMVARIPDSAMNCGGGGEKEQVWRDA